MLEIQAQRADTFVERWVLLVSPRWGLGKIFDAFIYKGAAPTELFFQWSGVPYVGDSGPAGRHLCRAVGFIGFAPLGLGEDF